MTRAPGYILTIDDAERRVQRIAQDAEAALADIVTGCEDVTDRVRSATTKEQHLEQARERNRWMRLRNTLQRMSGENR